jgi:uncharacterized protein YjcR
MEAYFENDYVTISYIKELNAVRQVWKEFKVISLENYQLAFNKSQDLQRIKKAETFFSDTRKQGIINPEQRKWLLNESLPKAVEIGMKRIVVLAEMNVFKRYYLNTVMSTINKVKIPFKIFTDEEKAHQWIKKQDNSL